MYENTPSFSLQRWHFSKHSKMVTIIFFCLSSYCFLYTLSGVAYRKALKFNSLCYTISYQHIFKFFLASSYLVPRFHFNNIVVDIKLKRTQFTLNCTKIYFVTWSRSESFNQIISGLFKYGWSILRHVLLHQSHLDVWNANIQLREWFSEKKFFHGFFSRKFVYLLTASKSITILFVTIACFAYLIFTASNIRQAAFASDESNVSSFK